MYHALMMDNVDEVTEKKMKDLNELRRTKLEFPRLATRK